MVLWGVIVAAVIGVLVYLTINKDKVTPESTQLLGQAEEATNDEDMAKADGVEIKVLKEGAGEAVVSGQMVAVNYTGSLSDGTIFDSNVDPAFGHVEPFVFTLGAKQVIEGWEVGVAGMKVGEKRMLVISPEFAYGEYGAGSAIPPNATLNFEVELIAVQK